MIYQVQQTSSQCPECSRLRKQSSDSDSASSSSSEHKIIVPINKYLIENNQNIERTLNLLQKEVQRLKKQNQIKQQKLKSKQAQKSQKSMRIYPTHARIGQIYENQSQPHTKTINSKRQHTQYYPQHTKPVTNRQPNTKKPNTQKYTTTKMTIQIQQMQQKIKQITQIKNQRIFNLQNQLQLIKQQYSEQTKLLEQQVKDNQWLTKFCLMFINMAGKISNMQGQSIIEPAASLRKNTKIAWKFFKKFIKSVIQ